MGWDAAGKGGGGILTHVMSKYAIQILVIKYAIKLTV